MIFKFFILLILIHSEYALAFQNRLLSISKNRTRICNPLNSLSSGIQKSSNFGQSYDNCNGYSCPVSGYAMANGECLSPNLICAADIGSSGSSCTTNLANFNNVSVVTYQGSFGTIVDGGISQKFLKKFNCNLNVMLINGYSLGTDGSSQTFYPTYFNGSYLASSTQPIMRSTIINKSYIHNGVYDDVNYTGYTPYQCISIP